MSHFAPLHSLLTVALLACSGAPEPEVSPRVEVRPDYPDVTAPADTVDRLMSTMTTRQKVAQLVMPWLLGDDVPETHATMRRARMWVDSLEVGGIIISTGTPQAIAKKLNTLQSWAPLPLLISADLEGGVVLRMTAGTPFPTQMGVGAAGREEDAFELGRITAVEGRAVGIHLAFAPVADVNNNPANPIINTRSFGADQHQVSRMVAAAVRGFRAGGMFSTAKHFPGHGDTDTDSHLSMPVIPASWQRFDTLELVPFRGAVAAGVDAIMSAHIAVPALDNGSRLPGTLSQSVMTGILRDSLGFKGLIATDALDMGGVAKEISKDEIVIRAFEAGSDLLLMPADPAAAITAMTRAVESGRVSRERLDFSVRKILEMKRDAGLFAKRDVDLAAINGVIRAPEHVAIATDVTRRSIVLLKDSLETVRKLRSTPGRVALVTVADGNTSLGRTLATDLRAAGYTVDVVTLPTEHTPAQLAAAERAIAAAPTVVLATSVRWGSYSGSIGLKPETATMLTNLARRKPTVLVSFGSPYVITQVPTAASYLMAWSNTTFAESAVAGALAGTAAITGTSPIPIPPQWPIRTGIRVDGTR